MTSTAPVNTTPAEAIGNCDQVFRAQTMHDTAIARYDRLTFAYGEKPSAHLKDAEEELKWNRAYLRSSLANCAKKHFHFVY